MGSEDTSSETKVDAPHCLSKRWILAYLCFYGYFCQYMHRTNLNLAIVCMVRAQWPEDKNTTLFAHYTNGSTGNISVAMATETIETSPCSEILQEQKNEDDRAEFDWDKTMVSSMLSSYYYGVVVTQVIGGWAAIRFGGKVVLAIGISVQGVCGLLTPGLTRVSYYLLFTLRVITGLAAGTVSPASFTILTKWSPPKERGTLMSVAYLGTLIGTVVSFTTSGLLCAYGFDGGWGSIFYIHGIITAFYLLLWIIFVSEGPNSHPSITEAEKNYINETTDAMPTNNRKGLSVPWKSILTSPAVLALVVAHTCFNWSYLTILTTLPLYMKEVLKFDIKQNGVLSSLPHICNGVTIVSVGILSDIVIKRGWFSVTVARKFFQGASFIGFSVCMFAVTFITCELKAVAVALVCLGTTFLGLSQGGHYLNAADFAPKYAGVIYGFSNTISCLTGTVAPQVTGVLSKNGTQEGWNNVFYLCIGISVIGTIVFSLLSRGDIQGWAKTNDGTSIEIAALAEPQHESLTDNRQRHELISTTLAASLNSLQST